MPSRLRNMMFGAAALAALVLVFMLYLRPDFLVMVADQISACF